MNFEYPDGATPLDSDEAEGLLLTHITSRGELDRWEQENIAEGEAWAFGRRQKNILSEAFIRRLHKRMFGHVWRWAGEFRRSDKNIGVTWWQVPIELRKLCDDVVAWIAFGTYPPDEIAVRFHHRLVAIHPFVNGNGRHARTMTDLLLVQALQRPRFTWGSGNLVSVGDCRRYYIEALRAADRHDYQLLLEFVRM
ncbi:mobile mystery protein B [Geobacter sulfurreducens]|jgi:Fic-DOC domain mobile mystery protein B|uniref:mobile mystery protein B n=1 Tax=Geobacter TaxID=28231 RepID=UPI0005D983B7|nr:mobile mystery protein B [Geobacter sulfurreducens]BET57770.1 mobile mystery protein B [Geobacter sp. 60473]AJY71724.1 cell division protein Fic [Geobacter sulfurreducens]QVW36577.1 mobile mystery protein B [Geobacter sulfurreducens]UTG94043.1 mobile mystery protein B [Geobacter sulfurreducens]HML79492.1 mobile mystery protein B [Geobacter sulfurreducens]